MNPRQAPDLPANNNRTLSVRSPSQHVRSSNKILGCPGYKETGGQAPVPRNSSNRQGGYRIRFRWPRLRYQVSQGHFQICKLGFILRPARSASYADSESKRSRRPLRYLLDQALLFWAAGTSLRIRQQAATRQKIPLWPADETDESNHQIAPNGYRTPRPSIAVR